MTTELTIDKGSDGKPRCYKGRAFHMRTKAGDSVVIVAADAQSIERTLLEFGVHVHVNWDQCPQVRISKDTTP